MKKLIIAAGLLMTTSAYAQTEVLTGVTRGKDYGVVYSLPKTQIELEIKANKVNYTPGEFSKYADRYLRLTNVSADPEEYWELTSVKVKSVGVPNSETTYFVKLKDKTVAPLMELTEDGIVNTINVPYSNSSVGKKAAPAPTVLQKKANPREFLTEEILMASSTAKMAELVAKEIYNIRESKNALLRGQADNMPSDGAQLKIMLDNLNAQEEAMTQMFSGTCNKEERTFTVRLTPDKEFNNEVAFRFFNSYSLMNNNETSFLKIMNTKKHEIHVYSNITLHEEMYHIFFNDLFKPSKMLSDALQYNTDKIGGKYISVSFRFIGILGDFKDTYFKKELGAEEKEKYISKCLDVICRLKTKHPNVPKILVTSDSRVFLEKASSLAYVYIIPGTVVHMDGVNKNMEQNDLKVFLDMLMISKAECCYSYSYGKMFKGTKFAKTSALIGNRRFIGITE